MEPKTTREFFCLVWEQREGFFNYAGMVVALLGMSGLIKSAMVLGWLAFIAFALSLFSMHIKAYRKTHPPSGA